MSLKLKTYRCGSPRKRGEGLRIGTVRFLPRGVKKKDYASLDYFDVWFPSVAPSGKLIKTIKGKEPDRRNWERFSKQYENELYKSTEGRQALKLLSLIAKKTPIAVGCYCEDEKSCHRSILKKVIEKEAKV
jgi:uncharacterized protein YeaO (DUF488 family)